MRIARLVELALDRRERPLLLGKSDLQIVELLHDRLVVGPTDRN